MEGRHRLAQNEASGEDIAAYIMKEHKKKMSTRSLSVRSIQLASIALALTGLSLATSVIAAGATMSCGEYSFGFEGTRLLNDGISNSAGPFAIDLPAGTYDVVMQSHDAHDEHPGQDDQTAEQWYFVLDSGYQSPLTEDVPDDSNTSVTVVEGQEIASTSSITLHHRGEGSINSVDVVCVGFTAVAPEVTIAEPIDETPPVDEAPIVEGREALVVKGPDAPRQVVEPAPAVEPTPVVVDVAGATAVQPEPQLALTGPTPMTSGLIVAGVALVASGVSLVAIDRRRITG